MKEIILNERLNELFNEALSYSQVYNMDKRGNIIDLKTKKAIKFPNTNTSQEERRKIAYNVALYNICSSVTFFADQEMQIQYNRSIFESVYPIVQDFQQLIKSKTAEQNNISISSKELGAIVEDSIFKYKYDVVNSMISARNLKAICEYATNRNIKDKQACFQDELADDITINMSEQFSKEDKVK